MGCPLIEDRDQFIEVALTLINLESGTPARLDGEKSVNALSTLSRPAEGVIVFRAADFPPTILFATRPAALAFAQDREARWRALNGVPHVVPVHLDHAGDAREKK